jgi:hypothetical protein
VTTTGTSFPLSKHTGGDGATPAFSGWGVYLQFSWKVTLPPSPVEFPSHGHFYKLSHSWLLGVCRCSCLLQPTCLFTVLWGISPPSSSVLRAPRTLCYVAFLLLLFIIHFVFFFFPWVGSVCPGGYAELAQGCLWEYCMPLSSPGGLLLPSWLGAGTWRQESPPGFSI